MVGLDKDSFDYYYDNGIEIIINDFRNRYSDIIVNPNARDVIWKEYIGFNYHCKTTYMSSEDRLLDRHKVVACYIYGIEKAYVLSSLDSLRQGDSTHLFLNEELAYSFGMSLLRALILDLAEKIEHKDKICEVFKSEIVLPECTHGDFKNNFLSQLYFTYKEGNYNILALAESLYLIECYNLVNNNLPADALKLRK